MTTSTGVLLALAKERTFIEIARLQTMSQWWHWLVLLVACAAILIYVFVLYRRDTVELPRPLRFVLMLLRVTAFVGLLIFFLQIEKRTEQRITRNSRLAVLVDTSQSMALRDVDLDSGAGAVPAAEGPLRRIDLVADRFANGNLLEKLRVQHDVTVYRFGQEEKPTELTAVRKTRVSEETAATPESAEAHSLREARRLMAAAAAFLALSVMACALHLVLGGTLRFQNGQGWGLLIGVLALIVAFVTAGVSNLRNPLVGWPQLFGTPFPATVAVDQLLEEGGDLSGPNQDAASVEDYWIPRINDEAGVPFRFWGAGSGP